MSDWVADVDAVERQGRRYHCGPRRLTERQHEVYRFIVRFFVEHGFGPTLKDIAIKFDFSSRHASADLCDALVRKGALRRDRGSRALALVAGLTITREGWIGRIIAVPPPSAS